MSAALSLVLLFIFFGAGMLAARLRIVPRPATSARLGSVLLYLLLLVMGYRVGRTVGDWAALAKIGLTGLVFAVAGAGGTVLFLAPVIAVAERRRRKRDALPPVSATERPKSLREAKSGGKTRSVLGLLRDPAALFLIVVAGFCVGFFAPIANAPSGAIATNVLLYGLLFFVGVQLLQSGISLTHAVSRPGTILLPIGTAVGTLLGGVVAAGVVRLSLGKALAVVSGFGWYSLSGVIITDLGDPSLGSATFLANLLRETIALLAIPLISRTVFSDAAIAIAGATSMDVTLPIIGRSCGYRVVPMSILHGALLSFAVPILVPLFYHFG